MNESQKVAERIKSLCNEKGITVNKMLSESGAGDRTYHNMLSGSSPSIDKIHKICNYLDISIDYLLERDDKYRKKSSAISLSKISTDYPHVDTKEYYIAFLDLLGTSNLVNKNDINIVSSISHLMKWRKNYTAIISSDDDYIKSLDVHSLLFSDNVVFLIECPKDEINYNNSKKILQYLFRIIASFQCEAHFEHGLLLRGGITKGYVCINEERNFILGKGLVEAHEMEDTVAIFPRVIINKSLKNYFDNSAEINYINSDSDGELYLNYINYLYWKEKNNSIVETEELKLKKPEAVIDDFIALLNDKISTEKNHSLQQKYNWTINYLEKYRKQQSNNTKHELVAYGVDEKEGTTGTEGAYNSPEEEILE